MPEPPEAEAAPLEGEAALENDAVPPGGRPDGRPPSPRSIAGACAVFTAPPGRAAGLPPDPPTLALTLQFGPRLPGTPARLLSVGIAANFGGARAPGYQTTEGFRTTEGADADTPPATVAVLCPTAACVRLAPWHPRLGHLVALALRAGHVSPAGLTPTRPAGGALRLALHGIPTDGGDMRHVFRPALPPDVTRHPPRPAPLGLRVSDLAGRTYALNARAHDLTAVLGGGGLGRLAAVLTERGADPVGRPWGPESFAPARLARLWAEDLDAYLALAAEQARLLLFFALRLGSPGPDGARGAPGAAVR